SRAARSRQAIRRPPRRRRSCGGGRGPSWWAMYGAFAVLPRCAYRPARVDFSFSLRAQKQLALTARSAKKVGDEPASERALHSYVGARSRAAAIEVGGDFAGEPRYHGAAQSRPSKFSRRRPWKKHLCWSSVARAIASSR